jgi:hypothetical protein
MEKLVDSGAEFIMGVPPGANKAQNVHRDLIQHKLEPRINLYARKLREMYHREGTIPQQKTYIDPVRVRQPTDTLEAVAQEKLVPAVIHGREEFDDLDLVFPWRVPFHIKRSEHSMVRPWYLRHPETEEEIRVTCSVINYHEQTRLPFFMEF